MVVSFVTATMAPMPGSRARNASSARCWSATVTSSIIPSEPRRAVSVRVKARNTSTKTAPTEKTSMLTLLSYLSAMKNATTNNALVTAMAMASGTLYDPRSICEVITVKIVKNTSTPKTVPSTLIGIMWCPCCAASDGP